MTHQLDCEPGGEWSIRLLYDPLHHALRREGLVDLDSPLVLDRGRNATPLIFRCDARVVDCGVLDGRQYVFPGVVRVSLRQLSKTPPHLGIGPYSRQQRLWHVSVSGHRALTSRYCVAVSDARLLSATAVGVLLCPVLSVACCAVVQFLVGISFAFFFSRVDGFKYLRRPCSRSLQNIHKNSHQFRVERMI